MSGDLTGFAQAIRSGDRSALAVLADWYQERVGESVACEVMRLLAMLPPDPDPNEFITSFELGVGAAAGFRFDAAPEVQVLAWWTGVDPHRLRVAASQPRPSHWHATSVLPIAEGLALLRRIGRAASVRHQWESFIDRMASATSRPVITPTEVGERVGRKWAEQLLASQQRRRWAGIPASFAHWLTAAGFVPDSTGWAAANRAAEQEFLRVLG